LPFFSLQARTKGFRAKASLAGSVLQHLLFFSSGGPLPLFFADGAQGPVNLPFFPVCGPHPTPPPPPPPSRGQALFPCLSSPPFAAGTLGRLGRSRSPAVGAGSQSPRFDGRAHSPLLFFLPSRKQLNCRSGNPSFPFPVWIASSTVFFFAMRHSLSGLFPLSPPS